MALLLLVLVGTGLRFFHLEEKSLWADELCTIATAMGNVIDPAAVPAFDPEELQPAAFYLEKATRPHGVLAWQKVVDALKTNVHPPLFFWLMNLSIHTIGISPVCLRLLSVLFGIACIPMTFLWARRLAVTYPVHARPEIVGLVSAAIMAFSGYQIAHAQDARPYTLATFLALAVAWLALRMISEARPSVKSWLGLVLLCVAGLYTQYFFCFFIIFLMGYVAWNRRTDPWFLRRLAGAGCLMHCLFLPWVPVLISQIDFFQMAGHYTKGLWNPVELPERLWRILNDFMMPQETVLKFFSLVIPIIAFLGYIRRPKDSMASTGSVLPAMALAWLAALFGAQILLDVLKDTHTITIRRYTLLAAPAVYVIAACLLLHVSRGRRALQLFLVGGFLCWMLFNSLQVLEGRKLRSENLKAAAAQINDALNNSPERNFQDRVIVHRSGANTVGIAYYLHPSIPMNGLSGAKPLTSEAKQDFSKRLDAWAQPNGRIWVVFSHSSPSMEHTLLHALETRHYKLSKRWAFPGVQLLLFLDSRRS